MNEEDRSGLLRELGFGDDYRDEEHQGDEYELIPPYVTPTSEPDHKLRRYAISGDAVLSAEDVVNVLGGRASVVRRWLRQVPPLRHPTGRRAYLWADIVARLKEAA